MFDKGRGSYYKGKEPNSDPGGVHDAKNSCIISEIHALQIISERIAQKNGSYRSYELNIVKNDGKRLNVTDHGNKKRLLEDANILAQFLDIPVWDAT